MATRRARVKLAPNLGARNKPKLTSVRKPAVVLPVKVLARAEVADTSDEEISENKFSENFASNDDMTEKMDTKTTLAFEETATNVTEFNIVAKTIDSIPEPVTGLNDSDWEDDQFTYKSVEVPVTDNIYKSLEITPLDNSYQTSFDKKDNNQNIKTTPSVLVANTSPPAPSSPKVRLPVRKNKFKPNLFTDRRSQNTSGPLPIVPVPLSPVGRVRSVSGSSSRSRGSGSDSEPDNPPLKPTVKTPVKSGTFPSTSVATSRSPRSFPRVRKLTESKSATQDLERSKFMRRKMDHKKKFMRGVPDRGSMTMFDLIYYNPEHGPRMSIDEDEERVRDNPDELTDTPEVSTETVVDPEPDVRPKTPDPGSTEGDGVAVPQVKVGVNGEIIIDDSSLTLETTDAKKGKDALTNSPIVFESNKTTTNYGTWSKKRRHSDWSKKETLKFYRALSVVGSDFSMMESLFKSRRTRQELKLKFKKEEKINGKMVDKCLRERGMYTEIEGIMEDSEEDESEEERSRKVRKRKRHSRKRYVNQGYYDTSSGEEDVVEIETPVRDRAATRKRIKEQLPATDREIVRIKRPLVIEQKQQQNLTLNFNKTVPKPSSSLVTTNLASLSGSLTVGQGGLMTNTGASLAGVQFPPGLLAANPSLAGAKPGSLVVVASPSKTDPTSQLLHVYMVSNKSGGQETRAAPTSPRTMTRSASPHLTLDPAVVRAVDRSRLRTLSGSENIPGRSRTLSESVEGQGAQMKGGPGDRKSVV